MNREKPDSYLKLFAQKKSSFSNFFKKYTSNLTYQSSLPCGFRTRIELGINKIGGELNYSMVENSKKILVNKLTICHPLINSLMMSLIKEIRLSSIINYKLFQVEFQISRNKESLVSLNYHHPLDSNWIDQASVLSKKLNSSIIGRSRKQKIVIGQDFVTETYKYNQNKFKLKLFDQCFNQPNPSICENILCWLDKSIIKGQNIVELHSGLGTFTILLSNLFGTVLSTENSRPSIKALKENISLNSVNNVYASRMSDKETLEALNQTRAYNRLRFIDLKLMSIMNIFLDPPRAGIDEETLFNLASFKQIIYISCGFNSLKNNLKFLTKTHKIIHAALFDQFPYTDHIESGVVLIKK